VRESVCLRVFVCVRVFVCESVSSSVCVCVCVRARVYVKRLRKDVHLQNCTNDTSVVFGNMTVHSSPVDRLSC
jgi:hypothetical protein